MITATIILRWPDGQAATAELQAESAEANYAVRYGGEVARLRDAPMESDFPFLSFALRDLAQKTGASYSEHLAGKYDRHAQ